jgi:hypothetical protein
MRTFWIKGGKSKLKSKSNPNSAASSQRKKHWIFAESPLSSKVVAATCDMNLMSCSQLCPTLNSLPISRTSSHSSGGTGDDAPYFVIDGYLFICFLFFLLFPQIIL